MTPHQPAQITITFACEPLADGDLAILTTP
jgi:hypothetical protein